jgi:hypothetical protein
MCAAFCAALALAVVSLANNGIGEQGTGVALRLTGRLSFVFFWPAYTGAALAALFGPRFRILAQHGREFGLAYASAHLVHVGLVTHLVLMSAQPITKAIMPFFAVGVVWTYVLAFCSLERVNELFDASWLRALRNIGLEYLALVFFADFVLLPNQSHTTRWFEYAPFSMLIIVGSILRMASLIWQLRSPGTRLVHGAPPIR